MNGTCSGCLQSHTQQKPGSTWHSLGTPHWERARNTHRWTSTERRTFRKIPAPSQAHFITTRCSMERFLSQSVAPFLELSHPALRQLQAVDRAHYSPVWDSRLSKLKTDISILQFSKAKGCRDTPHQKQNHWSFQHQMAFLLSAHRKQSFPRASTSKSLKENHKSLTVSVLMKRLNIPLPHPCTLTLPSLQPNNIFCF